MVTALDCEVGVSREVREDAESGEVPEAEVCSVLWGWKAQTQPGASRGPGNAIK
jgi:hypothetical protein